MPSSNRVIKANRAASGINKAMIATEYELPKKPVELKKSGKSDVEDQEKITVEQEQQLLQEAERKSQQLIDESKEEIEELKESAYEKGYDEGHQLGVEKGYEEGYNEGLKKAALENQEIRDRAVHMLHEAHEKMYEYEREKKEELLRLSTHMAEKIVHDYIDHSSDGLLAIAKPFFYQLDKEEEFVTISVHPEKREQIEENLDEIKSISPGTRFMILGNPSLEKRGILIESSHAVIDLQIKNQLERMLEEFYEMERTVDD